MTINIARQRYLDTVVSELFKLTVEELRYVNGRLGTATPLARSYAAEPMLEEEEQWNDPRTGAQRGQRCIAGSQAAEQGGPATFDVRCVLHAGHEGYHRWTEAVGGRSVTW